MNTTEPHFFTTRSNSEPRPVYEITGEVMASIKEKMKGAQNNDNSRESNKDAAQKEL